MCETRFLYALQIEWRASSTGYGFYIGFCSLGDDVCLAGCLYGCQPVQCDRCFYAGGQVDRVLYAIVLYLPAYTDCACHRFHRSVYPVYGMCDLRGDPGNDAIFANFYLDSRQITVKSGVGAAHYKVVLRAAGVSFGGAVPTLRQGGGSHF